jgi:tRNA(Ile)-lysidine synthase
MAEAEIWTPLHAQIHQTLKQRRLLPKRSWVLIAVSGGQDSLCLLRLLLDLQPKWNWTLAVAHCNHRWRQDADANADYVQQLTEAWHVTFYSVTASELNTSEAAAREWRYQMLLQLAIGHGYGYVVTGHTASDRAETLLYNLTRGSGADGLQALAWQRPLASNIQVVRPLLELTRAETAAFCQQRQLQVWQDSTNQNLKYARNRIRQELIPYLQTHFNPQIEPALAQTAELLRAEVEYLETAAAHLWQQVVKTDQSGALGLNRTMLRDSPLALQRRVIRQFLKLILPIAPTFEHIEKLVALLSAPNRSQTDPFPGGAVAHVSEDWIWLDDTKSRSE